MNQPTEQLSNFEIFPWNDHFCTGIDLIDSQHLRLVGYLNQLAAYFVEGGDAEGLDGLFQGLVNYADYHFDTEETIWEEHFKADPAYPHHCSIHQQFREKVLQYAQQNPEESGVLEGLFGYLVHWLAFHILDSDRRMAITVQNLKQGMRIDEAKRLADDEVNRSLDTLINAVLGMYRKLSERTVDLMREKHAREKAEQQLKNVSEALIEERLRNSEDRFKALFASIPEAVFVVDKVNESLTDMNRAAETLCGFSVDKVLGKPFEEFFHPESPQLLHTSNDKIESTILMAKGEYLDVEVTLGFSFEEKGRHYIIAVVRDISERVRHKKALEHLAYHDATTGLPNKASLISYLTDRMQNYSDKTLALIYLDIDNFHQVNDLYGVSQGDQLLKKVARRFLKLTQVDRHAYHLGGDEFVLILQDFSSDHELEKQISSLFAKISAPFHLDKHEINIQVSAGVSSYSNENRCDPNTLVRQASQSMYQAKLKGNQRFHLFDNNQEQSTRSYYQTLERIHQALIRDEFVLFYQPKVNLIQGEVIGFEALIRWEHPDKGLISPGEFLPVIETYPLSIEIGYWVIETALRQMQRWLYQGFETHVSVNLGGMQLQDSQFTVRLKELLEKYSDVPASSLQLEVLESSALEDMPAAIRTMKACNDLKVSIALDDFGTGYSSLAYLKQLPIQVLKIDQSFIKDILTSQHDLSILESIIGLGQAFHIEVMAEGLESIEAGCLLIDVGCQAAQGYVIARPMPAEKVILWHSTWNAPTEWLKTDKVLS